MIRVLALDRSAEGRRSLYDWLSQLIATPLEGIDSFPSINLDTVSLEELRFRDGCDVCVVGSEFLRYDLKSLSAIRAALPDTPFLAVLPPSLNKLNLVEQIVRLGANDVLSAEADAVSLYHKLIVLARRTAPRKRGNLILIDSAKGGVGVTSVAAALGEVAARAGRKVCLIDFDFETQDLSRFLQARPFLNENLSEIICKSKAVSEETLRHSVNPVWGQSEDFVCMPPIPDGPLIYDPSSSFPRSLLSVLEFLDQLYDAVIVDMGCLRGAAAEMLYAHADRILFLVQNDACSIYASIEKVSVLLSKLSPHCRFSLLENNSRANGLRSRFMREQFSLILTLEDAVWLEPIPASPAGFRWPASGGTLFSCAGNASVKALLSAAAGLELIPKKAADSLFDRIKEVIIAGAFKGRESTVEDKQSAQRLLNGDRGDAGEIRRALPAPFGATNAGARGGAQAGNIEFQAGDTDSLVSGVQWTVAEDNNVNNEKEDVCRMRFA